MKVRAQIINHILLAWNWDVVRLAMLNDQAVKSRIVFGRNLGVGSLDKIRPVLRWDDGSITDLEHLFSSAQEPRRTSTSQ